jgi:hypothetical protein
MASNVRFKLRRSSTYAGTVSAIPGAVGELVSISTNPNNYATQTGKKIYIGVGTETAGQASAFEAIGGSYYTQLLDGVAGVLAPSAAIITDANSRVSGLSIASAGTLTLNNTANTFNTTIKAAPGLAGSYALTLPATVGTAGQYLLTDGTGTLSWGTVSNNSNSTIPLNAPIAYLLADTASNPYLKIDTTTGINAITIGNITTAQNNIVKTNITNAYNITDGTNNYFKIDTTTATPLVTLGFGNVIVSNTLNITGGVLATSASTASLFNTATSVAVGSISSTTTVGTLSSLLGVISTGNTTASIFNTVATTLNIGGVATAISIGASTGNTTINNNLVVSGNLTVNGANQILNTVNLIVQDPIIQQGLVNGGTPTVSTAFDLGSKYSYFDTTAKNASIFWQRSSGRFVLANNITEAANVLTVATPTVTTTDYSALVLGSILVNDQACSTLGTAEAVISYRTINGVTNRFLDGVVMDGGLF